MALADFIETNGIDVTLFNSFVDRSAGPNACWPWHGELGNYGYGLFRKLRANEIAFALENDGDRSAGQQPKCGYNACCNPKHMQEQNSDEPIGEAKPVAQIEKPSAPAAPAVEESIALSTKEPRRSESAEHWERLTADPEAPPLEIKKLPPFVNADKLKPSKKPRISDETATAIREAYAAGGVSQSAVAKQFGVTQAQVSRIVRAK